MSEAQIEFVHQSHKNIKDRGRQKLRRGGGSGHGCSGRRQLSLAAGGPLRHSPYIGEQRCGPANLVTDVQGCTYGCLGFGDCTRACERI